MTTIFNGFKAISIFSFYILCDSRIHVEIQTSRVLEMKVIDQESLNFFLHLKQSSGMILHPN